MGKNRHSKDRLFVTATEHKYGVGGAMGGKREDRRRSNQLLPFDHCMLSYTPFADPVATRQGHVFDITAIIPYLRKHKANPLTGEKLSAKDLIHLHFHKDAKDKYVCPVTYKEFTNNSHIVMNAATGQVYAHDAVQELNIKAKNWNDLITGAAFKKKDIVTLQDPSNPDLRDMTNFKHMHEHYMASKGEKEKPAEDASNIRMNAATERVFKDIAAKRKRKEEEDEAKAKANGENPKKRKVFSKFTTSNVTSSFTSSAVDVYTKNTLAEASESELQAIRWAGIKAMKKKGYVRLVTSLGPINIELHCDMVPRTCDNFLGLCRKAYYKGVTFHRVIRNFMMQGGDPSGTGKGGESFFGGPFQDEFDSRLLHEGKGILSMANSGSNTNRSQFFITFNSCEHLNYKHSVFGRVVGGLETLQKVERLEVGKEDKPKEAVTILDVLIFEDPVVEYEEQEEAKAKAEEEEASGVKSAPTPADTSTVGGLWFSSPGGRQHSSGGVGKYLSASKPSETTSKTTSKKVPAKAAAAPAAEASVFKTSKKMPATTKFGNFSGW